MKQAISFRDRDGFVVEKEDKIYRYVSFSYAAAYHHLMNSGLYKALVSEGMLIPHEESSPESDKFFYRILIPEKIHSISVPSEWTTDQWKDSILCFIKINKIAIEYGMILKDATPFNFTFHRGQCVLYDTLSFAIYEEGKPWLAYRQFCESILGPASLMFFNDPKWGSLISASIEGWDLAFVSKNLPIKTWFKLSLFLHIHLHARFSNKHRTKVVSGNTLSKQKLLAIWDMLETSVTKWKYESGKKHWTNYYGKEISSDIYMQSKTAIISNWLQLLSPNRVVDLGANNGRFSKMAALYSDEVVAVESDHDCVNELYTWIGHNKSKNIKTILADITQPTPGTGWLNTEKTALLNRLTGDLVICVALIHHLCIAKNLPVSFVAQFLAQTTTTYLIIEFVPKTDSKVKEMLQNREDIFDDYTESEMIEQLAVFFELIESKVCTDSDRKISLWKKKK